MSDILHIPFRMEDISSEWMTSTLRKSGQISQSAAIASVDPELLAGGFTGTVGRLRLVYSRIENGAPQTVIVKIAKAEQEIRFYEQIAGYIDLSIPKLYFSARQEQTGICIQLLEDLAPLQPGDDVAGCMREQAELVLGQFACFHAAWWQRSDLAEFDWLPLLDAKFQNEAAFQETWRLLLPDSMSEIGRRLNASLLLNLLSQSPYTLIHGDCKASNFLFAQNRTESGFAVIDWQQCARGVAAYDIAYFCAKNLTIQQLANNDLLQFYHDSLIKQGVTDYHFDHFLVDYRMSLLLLVHRFVVVARSLTRHEERRLLFTTWLERLIAANEVHRTVDLLR